MKTEFELDDTKYTSESVTYNGVSGNLWTRRISGVMDGKLFLPDRTTRAEIIEAFDDFDNTGCD